MTLRLIPNGIPAILALALTVAVPAWPQMKMDGMESAGGPVVPAGRGYSKGEEILFIHTETSDADIAKILTDMMGGSPVLVVPQLADAPKELLAPVYVFTNGMAMGDGAPMGPLGGQGDIFPDPPGSDGYRPLRSVILITWNEATLAKTLKSEAELQNAIDDGLVSVKEAGVVVNMPLLTWPGGTR